MKKVMSIVLSMALFFSVLTIMPNSAYAATKNEPIQVVVNGNRVSMPNNPQIRNGSVFVPVKAVLESIGATVVYNASAKTLKASNSDTDVAFNVGSKTVTINNDKDSISSAPIMINSTLYAPVRDIVEFFNAKVIWNNFTNTVCIYNYNADYAFAFFKYKDFTNTAAGLASLDQVPDFGAFCGYGASSNYNFIKQNDTIASYYKYNASIMPNSIYMLTYYTNYLIELGYSVSAQTIKGSNFYVYTKGKYTVFVPTLRYSNNKEITISVVYGD